MPRDGSTILSDVRDPTLTIVCEPRGRRGQYNIDGLLEGHGDAKLTDLLRTLADCPKTRSAGIHDRCKAVFEGLRSPKDQPRRCVYVGTTNDAQYLPDEDNRRFYPFKVGVIDLNALLRDRDQVHAEAVAAVRNGEDAVVPKNFWQAAAKEQKKRRIEDPWEDVIGEALRHEIAQNAAHARDPKQTPSRDVREIAHKGRWVWFIASAAVLSDILRVEPAQQHGMAGRRARTVMGRLGWEPVLIKIDGHPMRGFIFDIAARGGSARASGVDTGMRSISTQTMRRVRAKVRRASATSRERATRERATKRPVKQARQKPTMVWRLRTKPQRMRRKRAAWKE